MDDTDVVRKSAARCLRRCGYRVLEARCAAEALGMFGPEIEVDMILADIVLPAMCGVDLVAEARRRHPTVAVAYMTGHLGKSVRCEISPEGGTPVLLKPFTPQLLQESVREALLQSGWTSISEDDATGSEPSGCGAH